MVTQHSNNVFHTAEVLSSARKRASENLVPSSTTSRTFFPSMVITSTMMPSLKRASNVPNETLKWCGAFCMRWHGSQFFVISSKTLLVSVLASSGRAFLIKLNSLSTEGCKKSQWSRTSCDRVKKMSTALWLPMRTYACLLFPLERGTAHSST